MTGKRTRMFDRGGNMTHYEYNSLDLPVQISVTLAGEHHPLPQNRITYAYDAMGNRVSMGDFSGNYAYTYDSMHRLTSVSKNGMEQISYTYNTEGAIATKSYGGTTTTYEYDANLRLTRVNNAGVGATYQYDASDNVTNIYYDNGMREAFGYNRNNAVTALINLRSNSILEQYIYTYDAAGRQISKRDVLGLTTYEYDAVGRLKTVTMPGRTTEYTYDSVGNRLSMIELYSDAKTFEWGDNPPVPYVKKHVSYEYSAVNHLLRTEEEMYDPSGTFVAGKQVSYTYDDNGTLVEAPPTLFVLPQAAKAHFYAGFSSPLKGTLTSPVRLQALSRRLWFATTFSRETAV
jgi:YD repeat-containing protein